MVEYFFKGYLSIALPSEALLNKNRSLKLHFLDPFSDEQSGVLDDTEMDGGFVSMAIGCC